MSDAELTARDRELLRAARLLEDAAADKWEDGRGVRFDPAALREAARIIREAVRTTDDTQKGA